MEEQPTLFPDGGPPDRPRPPSESRLVIVVVLGVAAFVFAVAAWGPGGHDALELGEGLQAVGLGVLVVAVPTVIAVAVSSGTRFVWLKFLVVIPLAVIATFVGFWWKAIIDMFRADVGIH